MIEFIHLPTDEEWAQAEKKFLEPPVIGDVSFDRINDCILIKTGQGWDYDVAINRLTSRQEVLDWIFHLDQKVWMTREKMGDFIKMVSRVVDIWSIIHNGGEVKC